jgi:hypothetical protein
MRRLTSGLALALLLAPGPATALAMVDDYRVTWHDGPAGPVVFEDGFDGPTFDAPSYVQTCGTVQPGDQAGGSLTLQRTSPGGVCNDLLQVIAVANALPGEMTVEADYAIGAVDIGSARGITVTNLSGSDLVAMVLTATSFPGVGKVVVVALGDETLLTTLAPVDVFVLTNTQQAASRITLQLTLTDDGTALVPTGRVAFDGGSFFDLFASPLGGGPADGGVLDRAVGHSSTLIATVPEPATGLLLGAGCVALALRRRRTDAQ